MGKYLVFDLETENHTARKRLGSPWDARNYVVARGWKKQGDPKCSYEYFPSREAAAGKKLVIDKDVTLLVGFNIKYDLLWEMAIDYDSLADFFRRGGAIWCCQYAEYLLNAQRQEYHMCALNDVAPKYGGTTKIDEVKALWEAGYLTSQVPKDLLIDYLVGTEEEARDGGDIGNTEKVFLGQIKQAKLLGMIPAIRARMDGMCATTEMEYNGLKVDVKEAGRRLKVLQAELDTVSAELGTYIPELPEGMEFNWGSPFHKSALIFGGTVKYSHQTTYIDPATGELARKKAFEIQPVLDANGDPVYYMSGRKKGEPKTQKVEVPGELKVKYQDFFFTFDGYTKPEDEWRSSLVGPTGGKVYRTGEEVIDELAGRDVPFIKAFVRHSALTKEIGTYYAAFDGKEWKGMLTCVDPLDKIIHHKLNHVNTVTTRLSSSDPNLQNVPRGDKSEVKKMFVSRFDDGDMIEADYSQLEVVVQGVLSGDNQLCEDLRNKIDFHCKRVSAKYGCTYEEALYWCKNEDFADYKLWKTRRTGVKEFSFQRAYGAGAAAIAYTTGLDIEDIKDMIEAEEKMYPGVVAYNARVEKEVMQSAKSFRDPVRGYRPFRRGTYVAPTGTRYSFRSYDAPAFLKKKGVEDSFSPPELKNYPVQGTGGEIVQLVLGRLWRHFVAERNYGGQALLVNTVHDCVWADCARSVRDKVAKALKAIMESVPELMKEVYGMDITVPFPVEVEAGPNMLNLKHVH